MVRRAFPRGRIVRAQLLAGGLRNANVKVTLDATAEPIVLRVYEHDASLCRKEADLIRMVGGSVPVPELILAQPARKGPSALHAPALGRRPHPPRTGR